MAFLRFEPIYHEKIWGGDTLATEYGRELPAGKKIGESWELVDREDDCSRLVEPHLDCADLHALWQHPDREAIFGRRAPHLPRFPILLKLLDCRDKLSVQVHPPPEKAAELGGEPKTELWYFLGTEDDASIYVGLKKGVTRADFEAAIGTPELAGLLYEAKTRPGDVMFLPSGRLHAIGAGNLIFEVQQNSDTTYRVDDWSRLDDQGQPRELHIEKSLASIDFDDPEPAFAQPHGERILECPCFSIYQTFIFHDEVRSWISDGASFQFHLIAQGEVTVDGTTYRRGEHL
ncbi:MAG: type I phosphomannose isomerase catalytic subunit, partial [Verrucomicrobiota bacterium]